MANVGNYNGVTNVTPVDHEAVEGVEVEAEVEATELVSSES